MSRWSGVLVGIAVTILAAGAHAADAPAPQAQDPDGPEWLTGTPRPSQPPPRSAPPQQPPPPPPGGFAPYGWPYASPAAPGYPAPQGAFLYEAQKKNELLALVIEFFIPGVGSIYADHVTGALVTWAATVGGIAVFFWWIGQNFDHRNSDGTLDSGPRDTWAIYLALGLIFGGRIYGLVDSYTSARDFNIRLRARLGMPDWTALGVVPIRTDRGVSLGPSLTFRF